MPSFQLVFGRFVDNVFHAVSSRIVLWPITNAIFEHFKRPYSTTYDRDGRHRRRPVTKTYAHLYAIALSLFLLLLIIMSYALEILQDPHTHTRPSPPVAKMYSVHGQMTHFTGH